MRPIKDLYESKDLFMDRTIQYYKDEKSPQINIHSMKLPIKSYFETLNWNILGKKLSIGTIT